MRAVGDRAANRQGGEVPPSRPRPRSQVPDASDGGRATTSNAAGQRLTRRGVTRLQRSAGNAAVARLVARSRQQGPVARSSSSRSASPHTGPGGTGLSRDAGAAPGTGDTLTHEAHETTEPTPEALARDPTVLGPPEPDRSHRPEALDRFDRPEADGHEPSQPEVEPARPAGPGPDVTAGAGLTVQRWWPGGGGGLLGGIRRKIDQAVGGIRSGWSGLTGAATRAFTTVTGRLRSGAQAVANLGTSVVNRVRSGLSSATRAVTGMASRLSSMVRSGVGRLAGLVGALGAAVASMDPAAIRQAFGRLKGSIGAVWSGLQQARTAMTQRIGTLWTGLRGGFSSAVSAVRSRANALGAGIRSAASSVGQHLSSLWTGVQERASKLSGVAGTVMRVVQSVVNRLLSGAQRVWSSVRTRWDGVKARAGQLVSGVTTRMQGAWSRVRGMTSRLIGTARQTWSGLTTRVGGMATRLLGGVGGMWQKIRGFSLEPMLGKLETYVGGIGKVKRAARDPKGAMAPFANPVASTLQGAMPAKANEVAAQHVEDNAGRAAEGEPGAAAPSPVVQRQADHDAGQADEDDARSTVGAGATYDGIKNAISQKWAAIDVKQLVLHTLWTIIWPWPQVWNELKGMWADWKAAAGSLFAPRTSGIGAFLHDIWSGFLRLLDFPLILWRRINNIALALWGWITIALVILGAVGGTLAGTVIGGIAGFLGGLGIGAAPGAGAGAAGGGVGGAAAGFGAALALGEAFVISFAAAEVTALVKAIVQLLTARQTPEEQERDYAGAADSTLGLAITVVLVALGWIGARLATGAIALVRSLIPRLRSAASRLRRGPAGDERPPPAEEQGPTPQRPGPRPAEEPPAGMSPDLRAVRSSLSDPRAIEQFDRMFARMGGDNARMQRAVEGMRAGGDLEQSLIDAWERANPVPRDPHGAAIGEVQPLKARAEALRAEVRDFLEANPQVSGTSWRKALDGEIRRLDDMLNGKVEATPEAVQGTRNNINGVESEFNAARGEPGVVGVGRRFSLDGEPNRVEVDVVSEGGSRWIDVKRVEPFGLESSDWLGGSRTQGLRTQAEEMLRSASQNPVNDAPPTVTFDFPVGVSQEVADALRAMGIEVRGRIVPSPPRAPRAVPVPQPDDDRAGR